MENKNAPVKPEGDLKRRLLMGLTLALAAGGLWVIWTLYQAVGVYARNQGDPWKEFDTDHDGYFTRAEVDELYGMNEAVFTFCDEDGDGRLSRTEYGYIHTGSGDYESTNAGRTPRAARTLQLLERPSAATLTLSDALGNEDRNILRHSGCRADFLWDDPRFAGFKLDLDGDGVIKPAELRAFVDSAVAK